MKISNLIQTCVLSGFFLQLGGASNGAVRPAAPVVAKDNGTVVCADRAQGLFVLMVAPFENKVSGASRLVEGFRERVIGKINATRRFQVVEREQLNAGASPTSRCYVLYGTVMQCGVESSSRGGVYGNTTVEEKSRVELQIRLADRVTGEIIDGTTVVGKGRTRSQQSSWFFSSTTSGVGLRDAADEAAQAVVDALRLWCACPPRIVACDGAEATINLNDGEVKEGDVFDVLKEGKELKDPVTGRSLGRFGKKIGRIKVVETDAKMSVAVATFTKGGKGKMMDLEEDVDVASGSYRLRRVSQVKLFEEWRDEQFKEHLHSPPMFPMP